MQPGPWRKPQRRTSLHGPLQIESEAPSVNLKSAEILGRSKFDNVEKIR